MEVVVVHNGSADGTPEAVSAEFPVGVAICSAENLGLTGGNNRGYAESRANSSILEPGHCSRARGEPAPARRRCLFGCNVTNDTQQPDDSLAALRRDERVGMAGPHLRYGDGRVQPSCRRFPEPLTGFFESTWRQSWPATRGRAACTWWSVLPTRQGLWTGWWVRQHALPAQRRGSGPLARRIAGRCAAFDNRFFMYSEEVDLCRRMTAAGWTVTYAPDSVVTHYEGKSSEQVSARRQILFNRSKVLYWRKWFGAGWAETLRHYLLLEFRLQLWLEQAKWLVGQKWALAGCTNRRLSPGAGQPAGGMSGRP